MKKVLCLFVFTCFILSTSIVNAQENITFDSFYIGGVVSASSHLKDESVNLNLKAKSSILIDGDTGNIIYENNADEKLPPASITKIMTLLLVMEAIESGNIKLTDKVNISKEAMSMGGSQIWLEPGEEMTVDDLLKATVIASANDAAYALGEHVASNESNFVDKMNKRAKELQMHNTVFKNMTGLDEEDHVSSARDIAIMSKELLKHDYILKYTTKWMDTLRNGETQLVNTNKLIRFYEGSTGLKTGTTNTAGSCLSASAKRNNLNLIAVVMGSDTSDDRFSSAKTLLDYGFSKYESVEVPKINDDYKKIKIKGGVQEFVDLDFKISNKIVIPKGKKDKIHTEIQLSEYLEAPIQKDQTVGTITIKIDDKVLSVHEIITMNSVDKMKFKNAFDSILKALFKN